MAVSPFAKARYRMAQRLHATLHEPSLPAIPFLPEYEWHQWQRVVRRLRLAAGRDWHAALRVLHGESDRMLRSLRRQLDQIVATSLPSEAPIRKATLRELYDDLASLEFEFGELKIDLKAGTLTVTTDNIVLEEVDLGRFEIVLEVDSLRESSPYDVRALDPNPPSSRSGITHPHVQDDALCEGEGRIPIRRALQQGRLFDFFVLVRQILETYNSGSAYVPLRHWNGHHCRDCGTLADEDDSTSCDRCGDDVCYECVSVCAACDRSCCSGCRGLCHTCESSLCEHCQTSCSECDEHFCPHCLSDGLCSVCHDEEPPIHETIDSHPPTPETADSALAPLHTDRLVQVPVPA